MSKYLSKDVLRHRKNECEKFQKILISNLYGLSENNGSQERIINETKHLLTASAEIQLFDRLIKRCEELGTTDTNTNTETQKPKQCKDCEKSIIYANNGKYRPQICFCKKHEKFVDEYTECLDEEE